MNRFLAVIVETSQRCVQSHEKGLEVSDASRTATFSLGTITADADGRLFSNYGTFALGHTSTAVTLTWTPHTTREKWRLTHFGTAANTGNAADSADPNKDGETNLLEFATGQNLNANARVSTPLAANGANLEFTYTRANAALADGVTFTVEWSDTLAAGSWSNAGVTEQILADNGTVQTVKTSMPAGSGNDLPG